MYGTTSVLSNLDKRIEENFVFEKVKRKYMFHKIIEEEGLNPYNLSFFPTKQIRVGTNANFMPIYETVQDYEKTIELMREIKLKEAGEKKRSRLLLV